MKSCSIEDCENHVLAKGLCSRHYHQARYADNPDAYALKDKGPCSVSGCINQARIKGFCNLHYARLYRRGDVGVAGLEKLAPVLEKNNCGITRRPAVMRLNNQLHYKHNKEDYIARALAQPAEQTRKAKSAWKSRNGAIVAIDGGRRRDAMQLATPSWLTDKQWAEMNAIYAAAKLMSKAGPHKYHVDHIVPIRGDNVCGLHVPWNLAILEAVENMKKSNKHSG